MRNDQKLAFVFCSLGAVIMAGATRGDFINQQINYGQFGSRTAHHVLTAAESPVAFWCIIAVQIAIVIALLVIAIAVTPGTPWAKARLEAKRKKWDAQMKAHDAREKMLKRARQSRRNEKRRKKRPRKGK